MTKNIQDKLDKLSHYNIPEEQKKMFIKNLYTLTYICYELYTEENKKLLLNTN